MEQTIAFTPWRRIPMAGPETEPATQSCADSLDSPCATCGTSPCCTYLPISGFHVVTMADLSYADYLLNFDRVRLGITSQLDWNVYYVEPCRFLDRDTFRCTVHGTNAQPRICQNYNPYTCWYRKRLTVSVASDFMQVDRARFEWIRRQALTNPSRDVVELPSFAEIVAGVADLRDDGPLSPNEPPIADRAYEEWQAIVLGGKAAAGNGANGDHAPVGPSSAGADVEPCDSCWAPCCQTLTFPQGPPADRSALDYFRFALGYPGIELSIADSHWAIVIKSACRHLSGSRCSIYGQPERPHVCRYYDSWKCTHRFEFGQARPEEYVRVRLDNFDALCESITVDDDGTLVEIPAVGDLRDHIERRWRERVAAAAAS